jgi:hypothetical protein
MASLMADAKKVQPLDFKKFASKVQQKSNIKSTNNASDIQTDGSSDWIINRLTTYYHEETKLVCLSKHGLAHILKISATPHSDLGTSDSHTLLHIAYLRGLPNMDVVRVLVEKLSVNVNAQNQQEETEEDDDSDAEPIPGGNTTLHYLARGHHWWYAAQAIPYLVTKAAANVEIFNDEGLTALDVALGSQGTLQKQAAKALISLRAKLDQSHLRAVEDDPELLLLVLRGVPLDPFLLDRAAISKSHHILDYLLSVGVDPNLRRSYDELTAEDKQYLASVISPPKFYWDECTWYALHRVACYSSFELNREENMENRLAKMNALLSRGADPYLVYRQPIKRPKTQEFIQCGFPGNSERDDDVETSSLSLPSRIMRTRMMTSKIIKAGMLQL